MVTITIDGSGNWVEIKKDGIMLFEGHSLSIRDLVYLLRDLDIGVTLVEIEDFDE